MNYLLVGIFTVPTAVSVPRVVFLAAAAACFAASRAPTAAPAATLLPRLPHFIFAVMVSRLSAISRGSSSRGGWAGEVGCAGLCPQPCVCSLVLSVNPLGAAPCFIRSLQKQLKALWIYGLFCNISLAVRQDAHHRLPRKQNFLSPHTAEAVPELTQAHSSQPSSLLSHASFPQWKPLASL